MISVDLVIKNSKLVIPKVGVVSAGVAVNEGKVVAIASDPNLPRASREIDAQGNYVFPGVIDTHTHFGAPIGDENATGPGAWARGWRYQTRRPAVGGVTTVVNMTRASYFKTIAGAEQITDNDSFMGIFEKARDIAEQNSLVDFRIATGLLSDKQVEEAPDYAKKLGVSNFKLYRYKYVEAGVLGRPNVGQLYSALETIAEIGYPAIAHVHCENMDLADMLQERMRRSGRTDNESWYDSTPPVTEAESVASTIMLADSVGCPLLPVHISSAQAVEVLAKEKLNNAKLYGETHPRYLTLTKDRDEIVYEGFTRNLLAKVRPALRSAEDVDRLWEAIAKGEIDVIGSDDAGAAFSRLADRAAPGTNIWSFHPGGACSTFILPVLLSEGVHKRGLPLERVAELTSYNAAKIMGMYPQKGNITVGSDADFAIVDIDKTVVAKPEILKCDTDWILYDGLEFKGWPVMTILRGNVIVDHGEVVGKAGTGRYLPSKLKE